MKISCRNCEHSSNVIRQTISQGRLFEKEGYLCCHNSEKVIANQLFTGKTTPRWCPLKEKCEK